MGQLSVLKRDLFVIQDKMARGIPPEDHGLFLNGDPLPVQGP